MASTTDSFAGYLRAAMDSAGLPLPRDVEEATNGVAKTTTIYRWLRGEGEDGELSARILRAVAEVVHVPVLTMFVAAKLLTAKEAGLEADPSPPAPEPTIEERIRARTELYDDEKEAVISMLRVLETRSAERRPSRQRREA